MEDYDLQSAGNLNMRAVVQETGLKPDTLRAWERRYGIPQPKRSSGGHRLYSQHDVELLKWLIARQAEGLSISRASALWHQLKNDGQDPLHNLPSTSAQSIMATLGGSTIDGLRKEWISACMSFDEQLGDQVLTQAFGMFPPETVCFQVLMKGLAEIGEEWYTGEISVHQEHIASELAIRRVETLLAASPPPSLPGRILVVCVSEEEHTFSALVLTYLLRRAGRDASFLGANVPVQRMNELVSRVIPDLVILIAHRLPTAANLLSAAMHLGELGTMIAYGGRIFTLLPEIRERIPGHFLGEQLEKIPEIVTRLLNSPGSAPLAPSLSAEYQETIKCFQDQLGNVEQELYSEFAIKGLDPTYFNIANTNLQQLILASLKLGDINFLSKDMDWIYGLLDNLGVPTELIEVYIKSYSQVLDKLGGEKCRILVNSLASLGLKKSGEYPK